MYSTLPHAPRHSQNLDGTIHHDSSGSGSVGSGNNIITGSIGRSLFGGSKNSNDMYSTLPHLRNNDKSGSSIHYDTKIYERFDQQHNKFDTSLDSGHSGLETGRSGIQTHIRSPSGDSLGRNIHLRKDFFIVNKLF